MNYTYLDKLTLQSGIIAEPGVSGFKGVVDNQGNDWLDGEDGDYRALSEEPTWPVHSYDVARTP